MLIYPKRKGKNGGSATIGLEMPEPIVIFLVKIKIFSKRRGRVEEIRIRVGFGEKVGQEEMGKEGWVLVDCPTR